jgi:L-threonylcarbamoyladenylate synthase
MQNKEEIIATLNNGGTILYPTDTIWGIGCDATNEDACQKILKIKNRPETKSFIILVDSFLMLEKYIPEFPSVCYDLAELATSPLTIIYPNAKGLAPSILAEDGSVGIRLTKDPICLALIRGMKKPLVSTSANISGEKNPDSFSTVNQKIKDGVDKIVMERLEEKQDTPSQIIKIGLDSSIQIIRK